MRTIHPAAWVGLLLNFAFSALFFLSFTNLDLSIFEGADRELMEEVVKAVALIHPFYMGMLGTQAISLGLIAGGFGFGLGLACLAGLPMLPGSIIYIIGCAITHYRVKYAAFAEGPADYAGAHFVFRSFTVKKTRILTGALFLSALTCTALGSLDFGTIFLGMALAGLYCMFRARKYYALTLHDDFLTLHPALFAGRILIPYSTVAEAVLNSDQSVHFRLDQPPGKKDIIWNLRSVEPEERRAALEELGAALTAAGVPLR